MPFSDEHRRLLMGVARRSIRHGFERGSAFAPALDEYPAELREVRAVFVTIEKEGQLRGCIGTLTAKAALVWEVAAYAYHSAFRDPRFRPLAREEESVIAVSLSILSPPEPIASLSEADLLARIRPGVDGLILSDRGHCGTFLPSVWEDLPDKRDFLRHLKLKAGLPEDHWSATIVIQRYTAEKIS